MQGGCALCADAIRAFLAAPCGHLMPVGGPGRRPSTQGRDTDLHGHLRELAEECRRLEFSGCKPCCGVRGLGESQADRTAVPRGAPVRILSPPQSWGSLNSSPGSGHIALPPTCGTGAERPRPQGRLPRRLLTDNGPGFTGHGLSEWAGKRGVAWNAVG